jgi:hypothetical protein
VGAATSVPPCLLDPVSQSVSYFTVPPRAHPSTGSQSGSATPVLTQDPETHRRIRAGCDFWMGGYQVLTIDGSDDHNLQAYMVDLEVPRLPPGYF